MKWHNHCSPRLYPEHTSNKKNKNKISKLKKSNGNLTKKLPFLKQEVNTKATNDSMHHKVTKQIEQT